MATHITLESFLNSSILLGTDNPEAMYFNNRVAHIEKLCQDLVTLNTFTTSLESYIDQKDLNSGLVLIGSTEAFDSSKVGEYAKKAASTAKDLIKKIVEYISRFLQDTVDRLKLNGPKLSKLQTRLKDKTGTTEQLTIKGLANLAVGNGVDFKNITPVQNLLDLVNFISGEYPKELERLIRENKEPSHLTAEYKLFIQKLLKGRDKTVYPGNYILTHEDEGSFPKLKFDRKESDVIPASVPAAQFKDLARYVDMLVKINEVMLSRTVQKHTYDKIGRDVLKMFEASGSKGQSDQLTSFINAALNPLTNFNRYLAETLARYIALINALANTQGGEQDQSADPEGIDRNLLTFIKEGDISTTRTALRMIFNNKEYTTEDIKRSVAYAEKHVEGLFEPYSEKSFARELVTDKTQWNIELFDLHVVYLKTNFSKERFEYLTALREYLIEKGEF